MRPPKGTAVNLSCALFSPGVRSRRERAKAIVVAVPNTGTSSSASRAGSAPMWSSCPCVSTTPSRRLPPRKSGSNPGTARSIPGASQTPSSAPQSISSASFPWRRSVALSPTSPQPPSGRTASRSPRISPPAEPVHELGDAFGDRCLRIVAELLAGSIDRRVGERDVARLIRHALQARLLPQRALDLRHQIGERRRRRATEVVDPVLRALHAAIDRGDHPLHAVVDVRVIARRLAVSMETDRRAVEDALREQMDRHLGSLARSVHGEEAQRGEVRAEEMVVRVPEQLARLLGGGVRADRIVDAIVLVKGNLLARAVYRRARGEDERLHRVLARE